MIGYVTDQPAAEFVAAARPSNVYYTTITFAAVYIQYVQRNIRTYCILRYQMYRYTNRSSIGGWRISTSEEILSDRNQHFFFFYSPIIGKKKIRNHC